MFLYHIPRYQLELEPGKKPNTKVWLCDKRVWLVLRICVAFKVSAEVKVVVRKVIEVMKKNQTRRLRLVNEVRMFAEG